MPNLKRANLAADEWIQSALRLVLGNPQAQALNIELMDLVKEACDEARSRRIHTEKAL